MRTKQCSALLPEYNTTVFYVCQVVFEIIIGRFKQIINCRQEKAALHCAVGKNNFVCVSKRCNNSVMIDAGIDRSFRRHGKIPFDVRIDLSEVVCDYRNLRREFFDKAS